MIIEETTVHILSALLAPGVLGGGLGLRWLIQRRNGNHHVTSGQFKTAMEGINRRFIEARGWMELMQKKQIEDGERLAKCEGIMSKGKE